MSLDLYEALWGHLLLIGRPVAALRIPGPSVEVVRSELGGPVPNALAEWFSWSNGVSDGPTGSQDDTYLLPGYWPLSLDEVRSVRSDYIDEDGALGEHWVPLMGSGGGDFYAAVIDATTSNHQVLNVIMGGEVTRAYRSIDAMLKGIIYLYQSGIVFVNSNGRLDAEYSRWVEFESSSGGNIAE